MMMMISSSCIFTRNNKIQHVVLCIASILLLFISSGRAIKTRKALRTWSVSVVDAASVDNVVQNKGGAILKVDPAVMAAEGNNGGAKKDPNDKLIMSCFDFTEEMDEICELVGAILDDDAVNTDTYSQCKKPISLEFVDATGKPKEDFDTNYPQAPDCFDTCCTYAFEYPIECKDWVNAESPENCLPLTVDGSEAKTECNDKTTPGDCMSKCCTAATTAALGTFAAAEDNQGMTCSTFTRFFPCFTHTVFPTRVCKSEDECKKCCFGEALVKDANVNDCATYKTSEYNMCDGDITSTEPCATAGECFEVCCPEPAASVTTVKDPVPQPGNKGGQTGTVESGGGGNDNNNF